MAHSGIPDRARGPAVLGEAPALAAPSARPPRAWGIRHSATWIEAVLLGVALLAALGWRLPHLGRGLGQDELFTIVNFVDVPSFWTTIATNDAFNNHPGYSVAARLARDLLGRSEWVFRLPALLFGLGSVWGIWLLSRSFLCRPLALLAALLLACAAPHIAWSTTARGYSGLIFLTLLSSYFYLRLLEHPTRRDAWLYTVVGVAGIYVHLYAALVLLTQLLVRLRPVPARRSARFAFLRLRLAVPRLLLVGMLGTAGGAGLLYAPMLRQMVRDTLSRGHGVLDLAFPVATLRELSGIDWLVLQLAILLVLLLGVQTLFTTRRFATVYFVALFLVPVLLMVAARPFDLYPRFFAFWLPYGIIFFVVGVSVPWQKAWCSGRAWSRYAIAPMLSVLLAAIGLGWRSTLPRYVVDEGYREASQVALAGAGASVPICALGGARSVWQYYIGREIAMPTSLDEMVDLTTAHTAVRCVYYPASWQSQDQTDIARFLDTHARAVHIGDLVVFLYGS